MKPIEGFKYDVVARCSGVSLRVLETLEYDASVDFEEWLATIRLAADSFLADAKCVCDEVAIVMRTDEDEGYYHGIVICRISSNP